MPIEIKYPTSRRRFPKHRDRPWWVLGADLHGPSLWYRCKTYHDALMKSDKVDGTVVVRVVKHSVIDILDEEIERRMRDAYAHVRYEIVRSLRPMAGLPSKMDKTRLLRDLKIAGFRNREKWYRLAEQEARADAKQAMEDQKGAQR